MAELLALSSERVEELSEALRESVKITAEREVAIVEEQQRVLLYTEKVKKIFNMLI